MTPRATSTVVDVTVFLLLIGAAATAVVGAVAVDTPETANPAADTAELLATSTASVEYALDPPGRPPEWTANATASHQRTAHGTVAELLGEAAMSGVTVHGKRLSTAGIGFERAVEATTRERLAGSGRQTSVRVRWEPYPGAPVRATARVGERPPPSADVRTATLGVASPMPNATSGARRGAREAGYRGVAIVVASAVVDGLFPPSQTRLALRGDYPGERLMATRYRRMGRLTDAGRLPLGSRSVADLNARLTVHLADGLAADMRGRFDSPVAAARAVQTERVHITVRTWSP
ncbi:DUF7284 family protein [Haloarcula rubra]|uniref:DUF7284 family protein n=1 Tax=Haloarcula rubra TaxID=2487747 RepID=UPI002E27C546|nr:hypothetical protein [Halomicroarcula rubra]